MLYLLLYVLCLYVVWKLCYWKKMDYDPPRIPGWLPLIGNALFIVGGSIKCYNSIKWISEQCLLKGGILHGKLGLRNLYCVTDPEAITTISNLCLQKDYIYDFAKAFVGDGLVTGSEPVWKRSRKLLNPAFNQQVLNSFVERFNCQAKILVDQLGCNVGKPCDHEIILRQNNLETVCLTVTGVGGAKFSSLQKQYLSVILKFQVILYERFQQILFHNNFIYNFSKLKRKEERIMRECENLTKHIIQMKRDEMQDTSEKCTQNNSSRVKPFLELLINISNEEKLFTNEQVRNETDTIIAAGHETSATVLNLTLIMLGSYPEAQDKVYNEVVEVFKNTDGNLDKTDLNKLVYTEAVLKEVLRLHPPVPVVARYIDKDIKIKNYILKANSSCFIFLNGLNRHSVWGPDADQFRPDRWFDSATLPDRNLYFGSFAIGKRDCIGKAYAMMSMKMTLAHVIRSYQVTADINKVVFKWHMLSYPASGHHYTLYRRGVIQSGTA